MPALFGIVTGGTIENALVPKSKQTLSYLALTHTHSETQLARRLNWFL